MMPTAAWIALVSVTITVLIQFAGIIWFAATQRSMLTALRDLVRELKESVEALRDIATSLDKRVTLLEDRTARSHRRSTDN
jgi:hypothetical protein